MTRYHTTFQGNIAFTAEEEAEWDAMEAEFIAGADGRMVEKVRQDRNLRLSKSDWMANSDVTMSDEWRTYRQALRDVPAQEGFPKDVTWPTEPS